MGNPETTGYHHQIDPVMPLDTPPEALAEIARLREKIAHLRNAIRNLIDGDVE